MTERNSQDNTLIFTRSETELKNDSLPAESENTVIVSFDETHEQITDLRSPTPETAPVRPKSAQFLERNLPSLRLFGNNSILSSTGKSISFIISIKTSTIELNPIQIHGAALRHVKDFQSKLQQENLSSEKIKSASYILCALIDETVLNTPWGHSTLWLSKGCLCTFHNEVKGGVRVFEIIEDVIENSVQSQDLLEFIYLVLHFGFEGKYRIDENGSAKLENIRNRVRNLIEYKTTAPGFLSPNWQANNAYREKSNPKISTRVVVSLCSLVSLILFSVFFFLLQKSSNEISQTIMKINSEAKNK